MTIRRWLLIVGLVFGTAVAVWALPSTPSIWNSGYETSPAASDPVSEGDDHLRVLKEELRQRLEAEHHFGLATDTYDNGLHRLGSGRCFVGASAPTILDNSASVLDYDNSGLTSGTGTLSSAGTGDASGELVGTGRCWLDTDDRVLRVYTASGWEPVASVSVANLLPNSHFSAQDNASTSVPNGWSLLLTPTPIAYAARPASEGDGLEVQVTAAGAANEGIQYSLAGLKASTSYVVGARVEPNTGDTCNINVDTSGGTDVTYISAVGAGSVLSIGGVFTTDATPTAEAIQLRSTADSDVCAWSSVGVFELNTPHYFVPPGILTATDVETAGSGVGAGPLPYTVPNLAAEITIPGDNYYILVNAHVTVSCQHTGSTNFGIYQSIDGGGVTACALGYYLAATDDAAKSEAATVGLSCVVDAPVPGSAYAYTVAFTTEDSNCSVNEREDTGADSGETRIVVQAIPRR